VGMYADRMTKMVFIAMAAVFNACMAYGQPVFKVGWNTYKTGIVVYEYTYNLTNTDSIRMSLADSTQTFSTSDSLVTLTVHYSPREKTLFKTANFYNSKKQLVKTEEYKDDNLLLSKEWRYDEQNRKNFYYEDNKTKGVNYRKTYEYSGDKKTGEVIASECSYYNGKIEFYTKSYFNKSNVKYKEVRLNDNNKDVVHIESYTYGGNGRVKERSVYFPEWKVTRKFEEHEGSEPAKCYQTIPLPASERVMLNARMIFLKKLIAKNQAMIYDKDCSDFEYKFSKVNCEVAVYPTKVNKGRAVVFKLRERIQ
jgi:hypothetical protein